MVPQPSNATGNRYRLSFAFLALLLLALGAWQWRAARSAPNRKDPYPPLPHSPTVAGQTNAGSGAFDDRLSPAAKQGIDEWIQQNGLNRFGDPQGSMYLGGTPLFDEKTGKLKGRYEYILEKHPDLRNTLPGITVADPPLSASPTPGKPGASPKTTNAHP